MHITRLIPTSSSLLSLPQKEPQGIMTVKFGTPESAQACVMVSRLQIRGADAVFERPTVPLKFAMLARRKWTGASSADARLRLFLLRASSSFGAPLPMTTTRSSGARSHSVYGSKQAVMRRDFGSRHTLRRSAAGELCNTMRRADRIGQNNAQP